MLVQFVAMYVILVGVIGGTGYVMFDWFGVRAVVFLAIFSAITTAIAYAFVRLTQDGGGGGGGTARAGKYESKGMRGGDR